jgi:hypothetical protein
VARYGLVPAFEGISKIFAFLVDNEFGMGILSAAFEEHGFSS